MLSSEEPRHTKAAANQPLSALVYGIMALVGLAIGTSLLIFYSHEVPKLVQSGVQNQVFYILLIPWGLSCAVFLFGALRSYARLTHRHETTALELGGPVVLFCLVLIGGFKLVPERGEFFVVTVRTHDTDPSKPTITGGKITLESGDIRRQEAIDADGEAIFKGIPASANGTSVRIKPEIPGYKPVWQEHTLRSVLDLQLEHAEQVITHLTGSFVPPPVDWQEIHITVEKQAGEPTVNQYGEFDVPVAAESGDRVRLRVYVGRKMAYDDFQTIPGPITIKLP